jgi:hypothetical protein
VGGIAHQNCASTFGVELCINHSAQHCASTFCAALRINIVHGIPHQQCTALHINILRGIAH